MCGSATRFRPAGNEFGGVNFSIMLLTLLMKLLATTLLVCFLFEGVIGHESQGKAQYYSFRVTGRVVFKNHQSQRGATAYVMWRGPVNGRIPWGHANSDGAFLIEFSRVSDLYHVCAHAGQTDGLLPLARTPEEAKKMRDKLFCSEEFSLDEQHLERRDLVVTLK